ncbi:proclotting enzyme-like [Amphibalanus amphitrite]|uniref:proclotting enzyme-like n=1 Tax=Amphibalanus amphitrite TaxID=1232801 RepID=UPI001C90FCF8|nr:proclotting enzyme-like [Amphibalanus amphitrite]
MAGWGSSSFYGGRKSHVLLEATIPIVSEDACRKIYEANVDPVMLSTYFPGGFLKSTKLCAGTEQGDMDVCSGDSGGPMVLQQKDGSFVLVGVVSLGLYDCGVPGIPSIYSRVSAYLQWIAGVIRGSSRAAELIRALLTKSQCVPSTGAGRTCLSPCAVDTDTDDDDDDEEAATTCQW